LPIHVVDRADRTAQAGTHPRRDPRDPDEIRHRPGRWRHLRRRTGRGQRRGVHRLSRRRRQRPRLPAVLHLDLRPPAPRRRRANSSARSPGSTRVVASCSEGPGRPSSSPPRPSSEWPGCTRSSSTSCRARARCAVLSMRPGSGWGSPRTGRPRRSDRLRGGDGLFRLALGRFAGLMLLTPFTAVLLTGLLSATLLGVKTVGQRWPGLLTRAPWRAASSAQSPRSRSGRGRRPPGRACT